MIRNRSPGARREASRAIRALPFALSAVSLLLTACGGGPTLAGVGRPMVGTPDRSEPEIPPAPPLVAELDALYPGVRAPGLEERTFSAETWWAVTLPMMEPRPGFRVREIGTSAEGRPLRHVAWGGGPVPVLLWSQMHGDESTASMALADLIRFLAERADDPLSRRLEERISLHLFPIMNPDGAARFQRRSAHGVDLNRDARALATPEARALKSLRDEIEPAFGFNLHDQAVGTRVGRTDRGTAIALLAPPYDADRGVNQVRRRAIEVAAVIRVALEPYVAGHIARWDDTFNPRAFGDLMTAWGTSTVLIESGGWEGDPEKQFLRRLNFLAILAALDAIAEGSHEGIPQALYSSLPENGRRIGDLLIRGGTLAVPGLPPVAADLLVNFEHPLAERGGRIAEIGDLAEMEARDTLLVEGLYVVPLEEALDRGGSRTGVAGAQLAPGAPAHLILSRDPGGRDAVWELRGDVDPLRRRPGGR